MAQGTELLVVLLTIYIQGREQVLPPTMIRYMVVVLARIEHDQTALEAGRAILFYVRPVFAALSDHLKPGTAMPMCDCG